MNLLQVTCYDVLWDRHNYGSPRKSDVPNDQSIRESASALIPYASNFALHYPSVQPESSTEEYTSGLRTLAYLNCILLYLSREKKSDVLLPENWQKQTKKDLLHWLMEDIFQKRDMNAIKDLLKPICSSSESAEPITSVIAQACTCSRYETFRTQPGRMAVTVTCDTCKRRIHRCCLMVPDPGMTTDKVVNGFLTGPQQTQVRILEVPCYMIA